MGDFDIDLLKDDVHTPIHDYFDLVYSHSLIPTIHKPTRLTEHTATIIDNILTNTDNIVESAIIVTDITDHMPTVLVSNINSKEKSQPKQNALYKRRHTNDNSVLCQSNWRKINAFAPMQEMQWPKLVNVWK